MYLDTLLEKIENSPIFYKNKIDKIVSYLQGKEKVLFITTSNRWEGDPDNVPKSTRLAEHIRTLLPGVNVRILDVTKLKIYPCEGNVSSNHGNTCGLRKALLKDKDKNPSGFHRCWASINNKDDELWKVSKALFDSDAVIFFTSVRWGQANTFYQKLIERLTWIENRHSTLEENNIVKDIDAGVVVIGQNYNGKVVLNTQKAVLSFFGFKVPDALSFNWQYTSDPLDETESSYKKAIGVFNKIFGINKNI
jgi:multimeric flavodoxin WrbA